MEASGTGIGRLDCYEDMFKEITRKLYGEDPDHRTSSVQNEFETSVTYKTEVDTDNGTDVSDDGSWTIDEEPLKGTEGSRIAAYRASTSTWRCYECGDCMGGGPREIAEHFVELHSSRIIAEESRRLHTSRKDYLNPNDFKLEEVVAYLERVRDRAERLAPPSRRTQETQTVPAVLLPVTSSFLLHELPPTPPQLLHQQQQQPSPAPMTVTNNATTTTTATTSPQNTRSSNSSPPATGTGTGAGAGVGGGVGGGNSGNNASGKRYTCLYCPYGTDRRDLYTRHENIHREEKPFHCYICYKPFSRADHVKKHFLRMHREHTYELSRIRRPVGTSSSTPKPVVNVQATEASSNNVTTTVSNNIYSSNSVFSNTKQQLQQQQQQHHQQQQQQQQQQREQQQAINTTAYQLQTTAANNMQVASAALYQAASLSSAVAAAAAAAANVSNIMQQQQQQPEVPITNQTVVRRPQNGNVTGKSNLKGANGSSSKANQERRYTCCYCSWSGVDNWCLKRHLNTHLKPFACALCEYKAARAERLSTHVLKVHNRRQCSRCSFLAEDLAQLQAHQLHVHRVSNPSAIAAATNANAATTQQSNVNNTQQQQQQSQSNDRQQQQHQQTPVVIPAVGGRAPPGPPVFPASSAAIAPATTVIPPTTILGAAVVAPTRW